MSYIHSRDVTYATLCQGPYKRASATATHGLGDALVFGPRDSLDTLLVGRRVGMFHLVCYLRQGSDVFETYWTNGPRCRGDGQQLSICST